MVLRREGGLRCTNRTKTLHAERNTKHNIKTRAYPVEVKAGLVWAYLAQPAPLLPDWEPFSWQNGFTQVVISEVPCNWFQCQENSIDPVHFEWMHENWGQRLRGESGPYGPTHLKLDFEEFEYGFTYKRIKEDTSEEDPIWTVGRVASGPWLLSRRAFRVAGANRRHQYA